jgi:hypothetical protein
LTKIEPFHGILSLKQSSTENKGRIREKNQITHKGKSTKITAYFSTDTLKRGRAWSEAY